MKRVSELVREHLRRLEAYTPGVQPSGSGWIKLNTNELPYPPPESVKEAIIGELDRLARYPNPRSEPLRQALAEFHQLNVNQVIVGNGSDDILNLLSRAFGGPQRQTVDTFPSYSLYPVLTAIAGGNLKSIPFGADFKLPVEDLLESNADLLFLTCPNAPTGIRFPIEQLATVAESLEGLLVIDEAYVEFAESSALPLLKKFENVVLTRTFSKAYGLAGLRVGYALAAPAVISVLDRIRDSYNVNRLSQAGALAALGDPAIYRGFVEQVKQTREWTRAGLEELGWDVCPSEANFLFVAPANAAGQTGPEVASDLFKHLEARKILVRYFPKHPLTASHLRISIGTQSEMERFMEEVTSWKQGG
jgi:histidinol-phosphate aminotransferase